MRGVVLRADKGACVEDDVETPRLPDDAAGAWALVRVARAGICGTDLEMLEGYKGGYEGVFGHEFVGEVVELAGPPNGKGGDGREIVVGQRVVGEINLPCASCAVCRRAERGDAGATVAARNHCPQRKCLGIVGHGGAFAEFLSLPVANLWCVDDGISDDLACFAEPLAAACRVAEQLGPELIESRPPSAPPRVEVAVIGDGRLGLLVAAALLEQLPRVVYAGGARSRVTVFGRHKAKLDILASQTWPGAALEVVESTPEAVDARASCFDICVEATATPGGFAAATQLTRPLGTVVLKSTCTATKTDASGVEATLRTSNEARTALVVKELRLLGSRCGPFAPALKLLRESAPVRAVLARMLEHVLPLENFPAALEHARARGTLKVQLKMN